MALLSHYQTRFALICSIALVVILIAINAFRPLNELVLDYDEVDYMQAANLQIDDLYLGTSTLNFVEFMKLGYKKLKGGNSLELSVAETQDSFLLRHFHGVIPIYIVKLFQEGGEDSKGMQSIAWKVKLFLVAIFVISIIFLPLYFSNSAPSFLASLAVSALFLTTPIAMEPFYGLTFHTFLAVMVIPFSIIFSKVFSDPSNKYSVLLFVILGLMVNIIVTATFIIFGALVILYLSGKIKKVVTLRSLSAFVATIFLTYPGQLLSLDYVKAHLMHVYKILVYKKEYTSVSVGSVFEDLQTALPFIMVVCFIFVYRHYFIKIKTSFENDALLYIGVLFIFLNSPFLLNNRYFLPGITLLAVWAIKETGKWFDTGKFNNTHALRLFLLSLAVMLIFNYSSVRTSVTFRYSEMSNYSKLFRADVADLKNSINATSNGGLIISDIAHILNFYVGPNNFIHGHIVSGTVLVRLDRENFPIDIFLKDHEISMLVFRKNLFEQDINKYPELKECNNLDSSEQILVKIKLCLPT
jgi:hypothetical protein